jgi:hypothetical protein
MRLLRFLVSVLMGVPSVPILQSGAHKVVKEGFVLLQFAPAVAARQYDWSRKQVYCILLHFA